MNSKHKTSELRKVQNAYSWISYISHMREVEYDNEQYHNKDDFYKQLERVYKNLDVRVVLWALDDYKKILQNTMTDSEISRMRNTNREMMIALLLDGAEDKYKTVKRALALAKSIDDGGACVEAMIHYHIGCPYFDYKYCKLKNNEVSNRKTCVRCKLEWLDRKVSD